MLKKIRKWLIRLLGEQLKISDADRPVGIVQDIPFREAKEVQLMDEIFIYRTRTQWYFGDWDSLASINIDSIRNHPKCAELALLAAAGKLQIGETDDAARLLILAKEWGCEKKLISQILISGVHNSLARAASLSGDQSAATIHYSAAISVATNSDESRLLTQGRTGEQLVQIGLLSSNVQAINRHNSKL